MINESLVERIVREMFDTLKKKSTFDENILQELERLWETRKLINEKALIKILSSENEEDL